MGGKIMWSDPDLLLPSPDIWEVEQEDEQTAGVGTKRKAIDGVFRQSAEATTNINEKPRREAQQSSEQGAVPIGTIVADMSARRPEFADLAARATRPSRLDGVRRLLGVWESSSYRRAMGAGFMGAIVLVTGFAIISWLS